MEGKGTFTTKDGVKYVGDFVDANFEGHGVLTQGKVKFEGEFKGGKKNGHGVLTQEDGTKVEGEWKDDEYQK